MIKSSKYKPKASRKAKGVAFLWDESFLWALMAYKALRSYDLPFKLLRSDDIRKGELENFRMLFVPGGWASNKIKALGDSGVTAIKQFVNAGGNYLGFCGGAGLATLSGIGLLNIRRTPTRERIPSFSGRICLKTEEHPIWTDTKSSVFHAWWPSQFSVDETGVRTLATYMDALPDSFSSDLNVGDVEANGSWKTLEGIYQINLDPKRLAGKPAVIEGRYGKGRVILSLIHFDTAGDEDGSKVLRNLWEYLAGVRGKSKDTETKTCNCPSSHQGVKSLGPEIREIEAAVTDLVRLGERNFLWFHRNPMLLHWRRGVRGLEYNTLYVMIKEISETLKGDKEFKTQELRKEIREIKAALIPFVEKAKQLLIMERCDMQNGHITYEKCSNPAIRDLRIELFSDSKSHGGMFKEIIDKVDTLLSTLLNKP